MSVCDMRPFVHFSRTGHRHTEARPIYLPVRRALPVRPRHRLPGDYRDMRAVAGPRFRPPPSRANEEHPPDRVRGAGPRGGDLCQYRGHSEILRVNARAGDAPRIGPEEGR